MSEPEVELLESIDSKLSAILALMVDAHLRETNSRHRDRTPDELLSAAGLSSAQIAGLLGKTPRAVRKLLATRRKQA
jgi:hypothetical protein